jgi:hypothetical protein
VECEDLHHTTVPVTSAYLFTLNTSSESLRVTVRVGPRVGKLISEKLMDLSFCCDPYLIPGPSNT